MTKDEFEPVLIPSDLEEETKNDHEAAPITSPHPAVDDNTYFKDLYLDKLLETVSPLIQSLDKNRADSGKSRAYIQVIFGDIDEARALELYCSIPIRQRFNIMRLIEIIKNYLLVKEYDICAALEYYKLIQIFLSEIASTVEYLLGKGATTTELDKGIFSLFKNYAPDGISQSLIEKLKQEYTVHGDGSIHSTNAAPKVEPLKPPVINFVIHTFKNIFFPFFKKQPIGGQPVREALKFGFKALGVLISSLFVYLPIRVFVAVGSLVSPRMREKYKRTFDKHYSESVYLRFNRGVAAFERFHPSADESNVPFSRKVDVNGQTYQFLRAGSAAIMDFTGSKAQPEYVAHLLMTNKISQKNNISFNTLTEQRRSSDSVGFVYISHLKRYNKKFVKFWKFLSAFDVQKRAERSRSDAIHGLEHTYEGIRVITLPADGKFLFKNYDKHTGQEKGRHIDPECADHILKEIASELVKNESSCIFFSDRAFDEIFHLSKRDAQKNIIPLKNSIQPMFAQSIRETLSRAENLSDDDLMTLHLTSVERQEILFNFFKRQLTKHILSTYKNCTNFTTACKDNIDRGSVAEGFLNLTETLANMVNNDDELFDLNKILTIFEELHVNAYIVKQRSINEHLIPMLQSLYKFTKRLESKKSGFDGFKEQVLDLIRGNLSLKGMSIAPDDKYTQVSGHVDEKRAPHAPLQRNLMTPESCSALNRARMSQIEEDIEVEGRVNKPKLTVSLNDD